MALPLLDYSHVSIAYGGVEVTNDVTFSVMPGQIVGLVGESGSGKSTLIKAAMGLLGEGNGIVAGSLKYDGRDVTSMTPVELHKLRGPQIGMVFQDSLASFCPIRQFGPQVYDMLRAHRSITRRESDELLASYLERLGLKDPQRVVKSYPHELSGGMGQRVGIAVAMMLAPKVLLADEPTSALDVTTQAQVVREFKSICDQTGCSLILVTHNIGVVRAICDDVVVLKNGRVVEQGAVAQVLNNPQEDYTRQLLASVPVLERR